MTQEDLLDRYTVVRELGRGAIGTVHAARDQKTGASAALKTLDPALLDAADRKLAELFLENARSSARLRHASIVQVLDAGEAGGVAYVLMELVEGKTLRELLDGKPLPVARAIRVFDDVASALAYAHEEGVVHRGVRPSNIFVLPSGAAKIGDFGLGQIGEAAARYMSPEQVRADTSDNKADHRTDLFSLGAVFYEMLTGRAPFAGHSQQEIRANILRAEPPRPSAVNPNVPGALDQMVLGLLAPNPDDRPASARLLLRDLQRLEEGLGLRPGAATGPALPAAAVPRAAPRTEPSLNAPRFTAQLKEEEEQRGPTLRVPPPQTEEFRDHHRPIPAMPDFDERHARPSYREREAEQRSRSSGSPLAALALALAVIAIGLSLFSNYLPGLGELRTLISRNQEPPAAPPLRQPAPPSVAETTAPPVAEATKPPAAAPAAPAPKPQPAPWPSQVAATEPPQKEPPPAPKPEEAAKIVAAPPRLPPRPAPQPTATTTEPQPAGTAKLIVAVEPQGEIYVDGEHAGTTPPLTTLKLQPGMHRIEIRNGSRKPYLTYMTVEPGDERRIRHDFNAKPSRPPA